MTAPGYFHVSDCTAIPEKSVIIMRCCGKFRKKIPATVFPGGRRKLSGIPGGKYRRAHVPPVPFSAIPAFRLASSIRDRMAVS